MHIISLCLVLFFLLFFFLENLCCYCLVVIMLSVFVCMCVYVVLVIMWSKSNYYSNCSIYICIYQHLSLIALGGLVISVCNQFCYCFFCLFVSIKRQSIEIKWFNHFISIDCNAIWLINWSNLEKNNNWKVSKKKQKR